MKKVLTGLLIGALVALPTASLGSHINEPTAPITGLRLYLENYALNLPVDCTGVEPYGFDKLRVAMYVDSAAAPSEHFTAGIHVVLPRGRERTGEVDT
jgi:hypothetical protein